MDLKSLFKGVGEAKLNDRGNPLTGITEVGPDGIKKRPAEYDLEITKVEHVQARKGYDAFVASFKVLASTNPDIKAGDTSRTWFQKIVDDTGKSAVKGFAQAVLQIDSANKEAVQGACKDGALEELLVAACGSAQPFRGHKVHATVDEILTKEKREPFNRHRFSLYSGN